jgi:hypothetical protein
MVTGWGTDGTVTYRRTEVKMVAGEETKTSLHICLKGKEEGEVEGDAR